MPFNLLMIKTSRLRDVLFILGFLGGHNGKEQGKQCKS